MEPARRLFPYVDIVSFRILLVRADRAWGPRTEEVLRAAEVAGGTLEVVTAADGEEAMLAVAAEPFDLAVADLVLPRPGISGAYLLVRIRELCPGCRTILVSDHGYVQELVGRVADAFIVRSNNPRTTALGGQLSSLVRELLGDRLPGIASSEAAATESQAPTISRSPPPDRRASRTRQLIAGKYRLESKLGQGGMGEVYRAEDTFIQRWVAVKLLRVQSSSGRAGELRERMHREAMIAGRLAHPHIVTVHDAGFDGEDMYLVMALVDGQTLRDHIKAQGALARGEAIGIALQILEALSYAHGKGVIHRDLKPSNVLMAKDGTAKVADFGIAKIRLMAAEEEDAPPSAALKEMTAAGAVIGTVGYMAPEQMLGRSADPRSDLYSLGTILYEMLHGRPLARAVSPLKMASCLELGRSPPAIPELTGEPGLHRVLERALALRVEDRYQSSDRLAVDLRALEG